EQAKRGGGVARDASLPHPEPRLDHGEAAGARRAIGGGRTVRLTRGLPGEARAYRQQRRPRPAGARPGGGVVGGRWGREPQLCFRLRQHGERLAVGILSEPWLAGEQRPRASTRWNSARDIGVSRNRPKPV